MDEAGTLLPPGALGEVVIRGRNVTAGYENNPTANAAAFINGWFRTGDQGVLDADGYLRLTGRLKELINRGGEKFSPLEVDEVLMDHPAVAQCLTFGVPHAKLGEEVGVAVVLRDGLSLKETELREFCGQRLTAFKVPRRIVFLDEIPKGATGKLQRIGLAAKLGLAK
jgi:acyl-CoA synthetase (AMP-forming)/AMP-acid ligase II